MIPNAEPPMVIRTLLHVSSLDLYKVHHTVESVLLTYTPSFHHCLCVNVPPLNLESL